MFSIKINHDARSRVTSLYLNKQVLDRLGGPGVRCMLTLLHPAPDAPTLFFCNSLLGTKIRVEHGDFDGWWICQAKNILAESTPPFRGLMPKPVWSADLNGFILKLDLMDWDLGIFPTDEMRSALRSALSSSGAHGTGSP